MADTASSAPSASAWSFSRWGLHAKARAIRLLAIPAFRAHNAAAPAAAGPDEWVYLDSTLGRAKGKGVIGVAVYRPTPSTSTKGTGGAASSGPKYPGALINFHGGGFTIGSASDDSRWARAVCNDLGLVVFSVEYRMAPEQPFPVPVEDCADAILALSFRAAEFGFDAERLYLSGFSAGGNLAVASWILLSSPSPSDGKWSYTLPTGPTPKIGGMILFYPLMDYSMPRREKIAKLSTSDPKLPTFLTDLFDYSYIHPPIARAERTDPRLSPGLMSDELAERCPPVHLVICEKDMLAEESRVFARRLEGKGKEVKVREVMGEAHGWDKPPPVAPKPSAAEEYAEAVGSIRGWMTGAGAGGRSRL